MDVVGCAHSPARSTAAAAASEAGAASFDNHRDSLYVHTSQLGQPRKRCIASRGSSDLRMTIFLLFLLFLLIH
jgi:hypothetical protein